MRLLSQALEFRPLQNCDGLSNKLHLLVLFETIYLVGIFFQEYDYAVIDCFICMFMGKKEKIFLMKNHFNMKGNSQHEEKLSYRMIQDEISAGYSKL